MAKETLQFPKHRILEYLEKHILVADGAMGTYYQQITGETGAFRRWPISAIGIIRRFTKNISNPGLLIRPILSPSTRSRLI